MLSSPYFRRLFLPYLILICLAIGTVGIVGANRLHDSSLSRTVSELRHSSHLVAALIGDNLKTGRGDALEQQVRQIGDMIDARVTIIADDGTVLADSEEDPKKMENHHGRPEIVQASGQGEGTIERSDEAPHVDQLYFAYRDSGSVPPVYVRLSVHLADLERDLHSFYTGLALATLLSMFAAGGICFYFARRHVAPLVELTRFAQTLSRGDLNRRVLRTEDGEIGTLASALNAMADSLSTLLLQSEKDRAELLTMLLSMSEGVIATDTQQRVRLVNAAASRLLDFQRDKPEGKLLWEVVRHDEVLKAAEEVLASREGKTFQLGPLASRYISVTVRTFPQSGAPHGLVIVAHDVTEVVRFQELRKELVANVSHELRTPLTAIKGFAETLRDGAINDPERAPLYLATIEKHADQLTNLVTDLLEISRLENAPDLPEPEPVNIAATVRRAAEMLQPAAQKKKHELHVQAEPGMPPVIGNTDYLERAVANLIDNAIKYTPDGGTVQVTASISDTPDAQAVIEVTDSGIGIPPEDLPRIFERFYRVDRSRSREMGGTGLGLSIVKHIIQVHRGTVEVTSTPGQGTTFRIKLPLGR